MFDRKNLIIHVIIFGYKFYCLPPYNSNYFLLEDFEFTRFDCIVFGPFDKIPD